VNTDPLDGGGVAPTDIENWPLLDILLNLKLPVPDVFESVIGIKLYFLKFIG
jgi:hypothetical protein